MFRKVYSFSIALVLVTMSLGAVSAANAKTSEGEAARVRNPFTTELNLAANSLRIPIASNSASAYNPYVEVIEALKKFDASWKGPNAVLLISDGLDVSH